MLFWTLLQNKTSNKRIFLRFFNFKHHERCFLLSEWKVKFYSRPKFLCFLSCRMRGNCVFDNFPCWLWWWEIRTVQRWMMASNTAFYALMHPGRNLKRICCWPKLSRLFSRSKSSSSADNHLEGLQSLFLITRKAINPAGFLLSKFCISFYGSTIKSYFVEME